MSHVYGSPDILSLSLQVDERVYLNIIIRYIAFLYADIKTDHSV